MRASVNPNRNPKTALFYKKDRTRPRPRLRPRVLLTPEIKTTVSSQNITEYA